MRSPALGLDTRPIYPRPTIQGIGILALTRVRPDKKKLKLERARSFCFRVGHLLWI